ncbi:MAG: class I SAM-dependent methyltransferase family protein [Chloroflexota bacterium]
MTTMTGVVPAVPGPADHLTALVLRTVGRSSDCIRLGLERGFDCGEMMDAIYRNLPSGRWGIGRLVDRVYLDQPGCRGLRGRKALLIRSVSEVVREQRAAGWSPVILDVAAGPATYLVELLAADRGTDLRAVARDRDAHALGRGVDLATHADVLDRIGFAVGDALDAASIGAIRPRPSIAIASGFYELLLDDEPIGRSMAILREALEPGGTLVFTTQVAHPQVALMSLVPAHDGRPWIIRNRSVAQVEALAHAAGFGHVETRLEPAGIFAVSVAR